MRPLGERGWGFLVEERDEYRAGEEGIHHVPAAHVGHEVRATRHLGAGGDGARGLDGGGEAANIALHDRERYKKENRLGCHSVQQRGPVSKHVRRCISASLVSSETMVCLRNHPSTAMPRQVW